MFLQSLRLLFLARRIPARRLTALALAGVLLGPMVMVTDAWAALHEQLAICNQAIAMANAVTAYPPGVMAVHFNPAGLTKLRGTQVDMGLHYPDLSFSSRWEAPPGYTGFLTYRDDPVIGTESTTSGGAIILPFNGPVSNFLAGPNFGISYNPPGAAWTAGFAIYAPFAAGFERPDGPGVFGGQFLGQQRLVMGPAIGYKLTKTLSLGASIGLGTANMGMRMAFRAPHDLVALTGLLGDITTGLDDVITLGLIPFPLFGGGLNPFDSVGVVEASDLQDNFNHSYNLGVLWEPSDWFATGVCYQSESEVKFAGNYRLDYGKPWQNMMDWLVANQILEVITRALGLPTEGGVLQETGRSSLQWTFPRRVQAGIMVRPVKRLRLTMDVNWINWSTESANVFRFDQDIQLLQIARLLGYPYPANTLVFKRNLVDTVHFSYGMEVELTKWLRMRAGYEDRPTSIREHLRDTTFGLPDMKVHSFGLAADVTRNTTLEFAFAYIKGEDISMEQNKGQISTNLNSRSLTALVYNPYSGLDYYQETNAIILSFGMSYRW